MSTQLVAIYDMANPPNLLLTIDVTMSEQHSAEVEATDHPVEQGVNITDHIRPKPRTLTIEGLISDTPVISGAFALLQGLTFPAFGDGSGSPAEQAYQFLESLRTGGQLLQVVTRYNAYSNMILMSISEPRDHTTGDALLFTLSFKEARIVFNQTIVVQTAAPQHQPKQLLGKKAAGAANPSANDATVAKEFFNNLGVTTSGSGK